MIRHVFQEGGMSVQGNVPETSKTDGQRA